MERPGIGSIPTGLEGLEPPKVNLKKVVVDGARGKLELGVVLGAGSGVESGPWAVSVGGSVSVKVMPFGSMETLPEVDVA